MCIPVTDNPYLPGEIPDCPLDYASNIVRTYMARGQQNSAALQSGVELYPVSPLTRRQQEDMVRADVCFWRRVGEQLGADPDEQDEDVRTQVRFMTEQYLGLRDRK